MKGRLWVAFLIFLALALGGLGLLLRTSRDPGERPYQKAEALLSAGDFESAAAAYGEIATKFPRSRWADDALYKQGFILSNYLGRWTEAIQAFQSLAQHSESPLKDDGLLAMAGVYETALAQPDKALDVYRGVLQEYGSIPDVAAEAELGIARCLVSKGDEGAFAACDDVLRQHANLRDVTAEAEYLLAQAYQNIRHDPEEAMRRYGDVTEKYSGTPWAAKAANELGWHFYQALKKEEQTRVLLELPGSEALSPTAGAPLAAPVLAALLGSAGGLSGEGFAGLSGEAFRFFFYPEEPSRGPETFYRNPFTAASQALGLACFYDEFQSQDRARNTLKRALFEGHPVVTSLAGPPRAWGIVIGSDAVRGEIYVQDPFTKYRAYRSEEFTARWGGTTAPRLLVLGKAQAAETYPVFFLVESQSKKNLREAAATALKTTVADLRRESAEGGGFASFQAFQALIDELEAPENWASPAILSKIASWNAVASPNLVSCRRAAVAFLNQVAAAFPSGAQRHLRYAAEDYGKEVQLLQRARELLPTAPVSETEAVSGGLTSTGESLLKAGAVLRDALQYEHSAVSHLSEAMKGL